MFWRDIFLVSALILALYLPDLAVSSRYWHDRQRMGEAAAQDGIGAHEQTGKGQQKAPVAIEYAEVKITSTQAPVDVYAGSTGQVEIVEDGDSILFTSNDPKEHSNPTSHQKHKRVSVLKQNSAERSSNVAAEHQYRTSEQMQ